MRREKRIWEVCKSFILGGILILLPLNVSLASPLVGRMTTNFILKDLTGRELALKDFRGKITVLVFGELYQQNTLKAINDLEEILSKKLSYRESVEVLLIISEKKKPEEHLKVKSGLGISYPILIDDQRKVYAQYEIIAIPTSFIIDRTGKIVIAFPSYTIAYYDQMDAELGYLLGEVKKEELESVLHPKAIETRMNGKTERYLALADSLKERGFYDSAMDAYRKVLERKPDSTKAHLGMGIIYLDKAELEKAEKEFQAVLKKNPDDPAALKGMAQVYLHRGNIDEAEELLKKVLSSNYMDEDIFYVMGELYEKKGNLKEAIEYYKRNSQRLLQKRWLK
ncbi:MAG: tetratricopeptide repeat protein [Thermodesulfobacteriota bacterium]